MSKLPNNVSKPLLIDAIVKETGTTKKLAEEMLAATIKTITTTLKKGGKVALVGFGTFAVSKRKARKGRNPKSGAEIKIPACKAPRFTAGKSLKDAVNGSK